MGIPKLNLVLDMDETLIHSFYITEEIKDFEKDKLFLCGFKNDCRTYYVYFRPGLFEFLIEVEKYFNLYIYTFGVKIYADIIVNAIGNKLGKNIFTQVYTRENFYNEKKLLFNPSNDSNTIILDDNVKIWHKTKNVIQIKAYYGPEEKEYYLDTELSISLKRIMSIKNLYDEIGIIYIDDINVSNYIDIDTDDEDIIMEYKLLYSDKTCTSIF